MRLAVIRCASGREAAAFRGLRVADPRERIRDLRGCGVILSRAGMAVEPQRSERAGLDPGALEALADAGRAAARGSRLGDVLRAVVEAAAGLTGADVVLVRVVDPERPELVVRAVAGPSAALAVELEGERLPVDGLPPGEVDLDEAHEPLARLAERLGAESALVVPVVVGEDVEGTRRAASARG